MPFVNKFLKDFNKDVYLEPAPVKCKWGCHYYEELKSCCVGSTAVSFSNNLWVIKIRNKFVNAYSPCTNSFLPTSIALAPNWIGSSKKQKICNNWHKSHQQIRCRQKCKDSNEWSFAVALSEKKRNSFFSFRKQCLKLDLIWSFSFSKLLMPFRFSFDLVLCGTMQCIYLYFCMTGIHLLNVKLKNRLFNWKCRRKWKGNDFLISKLKWHTPLTFCMSGRPFEQIKVLLWQWK